LGILSPDPASYADPASGSELAAFILAMHELGYVEGRNLRIEFRFAENRLDRLPALASELVAWGPDVIYTHTSGGAQAAANATKTIPIVVGPAGETVMLALAGNLAHPTGNVTGLAIEGPELYEKCLQLLKEMRPDLARVGVLVNPENPAWADFPAILSPAAVQLSLVLVRAATQGAADIDRTLAGLQRENLSALLVVNDSTFRPNGLVGSRIIDFARELRLPSASPSVNYARYGALLSIGIEQRHLRRRAAEYVSRIIEGARPGDLPIERPTKFELVINLRTAKAIGVTVPTAIMLRADEVIE
jgi:putative ABC transport system substrate-binding protein